MHVFVWVRILWLLCICLPISLFIYIFKLCIWFFHYNRTEQVYRFFQQWCPNIHNATDEESDEDVTSPGFCATADGEVNVVDLTPTTRSHVEL